MAATTPPTVLLLITLISDHSPPPPPQQQQQASPFPITITMLSTFTFFFFLTLFIIIYTLYTLIKNNTNEKEQQQRFIKIQSLPVNGDNSKSPHQKQENVGRTLLVEILPSNSPKWDTLFSSKGADAEGITSGSGQEEEKKRKKKRAKKKKPEEVVEVGGGELVVGVYPFTKSSSATQRKIKQQYDQLVKSHGSKGLTLDQVGQFVNCLVEARNELQNKSEVIKRRFTITKALLLKADRSSFDRLRQQIYKLELEQKRLEEDAFVYNWLQEQLKASPAYKRMLEIGACMEMKEKDRALLESKDDDFCDISFEELLEQEKKDVFWQRNGRFKPSSG